jgi:TolA-binding protein
MPAVKSTDPELAAPPAPDEDELKARLAAEIEKSEKLAESQLHMAEWFLNAGKTDIAKRRLQLLIETLPESNASKQARKMLKKL